MCHEMAQEVKQSKHRVRFISCSLSSAALAGTFEFDLSLLYRNARGAVCPPLCNAGSMYPARTGLFSFEAGVANSV